MSQHTRSMPQSKDALLKSYTKRLKDDIRSMLDNFTEIIKLARVSQNMVLFTPELVMAIFPMQIAFFW